MFRVLQKVAYTVMNYLCKNKVIERIHMHCKLNIFVLGTILVSTHCNQALAFSFSHVFSFFGKYSYESTFTKEYELKNPGTLTIHNKEGSIKIKTAWKQNKIYLTAIKKSSNELFLPEISIDEQLTTKDNQTNVTLKTKYRSTATKGCIDYVLIVPENMTVNLTNDTGDIIVNELNNPLIATTTHGNISIYNTKNTITAQAQERGSIIIDRAKGNVRATSANGDISIEDASNSIIATTQKGSIYTTITNLPPTSRILLTTHSGNIELGMPSLVNASVSGKTERGSVKSDHYITLKQRITKLNNEVWAQLKREIDGTIGTGEAEIKLNSGSGNIKITEITA